jgi:hypothetical protein
MAYRTAEATSFLNNKVNLIENLEVKYLPFLKKLQLCELVHDFCIKNTALSQNVDHSTDVTN